MAYRAWREVGVDDQRLLRVVVRNRKVDMLGALRRDSCRRGDYVEPASCELAEDGPKSVSTHSASCAAV